MRFLNKHHLVLSSRVCDSGRARFYTFDLAVEMYDVVVVGAGIEGSATAYNLVKNGQKTLLLEQVSYITGDMKVVYMYMYI